ncbi:MAG: sulfite exporter TauE/SafE family protein [Acidobacteria bacterium]|nr:sulfite exporter TauE/SafE family protein [Acidobacteriota bacterium]
MHFPVSGVDCSPLLPPLVAFAISTLTASAGVSGAFLLLPFQMSVLGFVTPAVSPTNLVYNIVAVPGGVYRYIREGRMTWPLAWAIVVGTLPGLFFGALIRIHYLPDPKPFKVFVGFVLLYLAVRLIRGLLAAKPRSAMPAGATVKTVSVSPTKIEYEFRGDLFAFRPAAILALAAVVGLIGGIYGIGGGAIIAPFIVAVFGLPVYTVAGAALFGTFASSVAGAGFFELLGLSSGRAVRPDWALGMLFGIGGLLGTYTGARLQKHLPERWIRVFLSVLITGLAISYVAQYFL